jgi:LacI family transcriptional regulator
MPRRATTLDQVAASAGVSRMTASRALNNQPGVSTEVRERILRIANELGYVPNRAARDLAAGRPRVIGLLCADMHAPFVAEIISGAVRAARSAGYEVLLYSLLEPHEELREGVAPLLARSTQGVISTVVHRHDHLPQLRAAGVQVVNIENPEGGGSTVTADHYNGARSALRHLLELGHRRIGYIGSHDEMISSRERRRAWEDVQREQGLPRDRQLLVKGDNTQATGFLAAQRLLALPSPPTAIFANNDPTALGVLEAARLLGVRVPRDLSVVGFDDVPQAAQSHPPLTTVRQPLEQMGRSAVNTLLALLAGIDPVAPIITFPTELVVRGSTAAPRKGKLSLHRQRKGAGEGPDEDAREV